jgi:hypothetical protein
MIARGRRRRWEEDEVVAVVVGEGVVNVEIQ